MTKWINRLYIVVPAGQLNAANRRGDMGAIFTDGGSGESADDESLLFDSVPLSDDGIAPITHYGTNTVATASMTTDLLAYVDANLPPSRWWHLSALTELLITKSPGAGGTIGQPFTFEQALADVSKIRIEDAI